MIAAVLLCLLLAVTGRFIRRGRESQDQAEFLLAELQDAREGEAAAVALAERSRIAGELHDVLAHALSGLAIQLQGARKLRLKRACQPGAAGCDHRAVGGTGPGRARGRPAGRRRAARRPPADRRPARRPGGGLPPRHREDDVSLLTEGTPLAAARGSGAGNVHRGAGPLTTSPPRPCRAAATVTVRYAPTAPPDCAGHSCPDMRGNRLRGWRRRAGLARAAGTG